jgi:hypothetical protein
MAKPKQTISVEQCKSNWIEQDALRHEESKKQWNPWLHKVAEALKGFPWITDVSCPSRSALAYHFENPENYFATSGDGLLELLFEVVSYEGDGKIRYVNLWEVAGPSKHEKKHYKWEPGKAYPSIAGGMIHQRGIRHCDEMTFPELIEHIEAMVETRRKRYA